MWPGRLQQASISDSESSNFSTYLGHSRGRRGTLGSMRRFTLLLVLGLVGALTPIGPGALATHGGSFSIDYNAADPALYGPAFPATTACPGGGRASAPLAGADHSTGLKSLRPDDMELGQIVVFEFAISVGSSAPADSQIEFTAGWDTVTTAGGDFGYDEGFLVYCAFVDPSDGASTEVDADATVVGVVDSLVGDEIQGIFQVAGLDPNEVIVVEVWLVLDVTIPSNAQGNVQSRLINATALSPPDTDNINTGNQAIPILQVQAFLQTARIVIVKEIAAGSDTTQKFEFSGAITATLGDGQTASLAVEPGTYMVIESVPAGWEDPSIGCDDGDSSGSGVTATFIAAGGETVTCTFTNAQVPPGASTTTTTLATTTTLGTTTTLPAELPHTGGAPASMTILAAAMMALGGFAFIVGRRKFSA